MGPIYNIFNLQVLYIMDIYIILKGVKVKPRNKVSYTRTP